MKRQIALIFVMLGVAAVWAQTAASADKLSIIGPEKPSALETLAAREICRYVYLRTGKLLPIVESQAALPRGAGGFIVARKDRPVVPQLASLQTAALGPEQYLLHTFEVQGRRFVAVVGGDDVGTLYGAYRLAEHLGVRFYVHGDVLPDQRVKLTVPDLDETGKPLFATRGIQPFHDFFEGPDWWNLDDYKAYIAQLPKLRMNFFGLHCYPEGGVGPEPAVWIGAPGEFDDAGRVKASYPSSWGNTQRPMWGMKPTPTSRFAAGAGLLFALDAYGPDSMNNEFPLPKSPAACNDVFNRTAALLRESFSLAHALGVKTCIGTETPLTIPKPVQERLKAQGKNPADLATVRQVYEGIFARISKAYPVDYYWLWTDENWTWGNPDSNTVERVKRDLLLAGEAIANVRAPFSLATCGWVLGPPGQRDAFNQILPKTVPLSCINRSVGHSAVEPAFAAIEGRPLWAIPWLENDPALTAPQLWVGRMRYDATDALRYGCTGLLGIHWRTKALAMNIAALAQASWVQSWTTGDTAAPEKFGALGGNLAQFPQTIAGTDDCPVYQSVRYDVDTYHFKVPNGTYTVILKFCEPHYNEAGKRVFGVKLQGRTVIDKLDLLAKAGKDKALDYTFKDVSVAKQRLDIDFIRIVEFPCIAGIAIAGPSFTRMINCGGPAWKDYESDQDMQPASRGEDRTAPTLDYYRDWARASFGADPAGEAIAALFARIDGRSLPEPCTWIRGPGSVKTTGTPWEQERKRYAFVDDFAALRAQVSGPGNLERFDYWLNTFRAMQSMARFGCALGQLDAVMGQLAKETDSGRRKELARQKALPVRLEIARLWTELIGFNVATVSTPGELGTIANLEQQSRGTLNLVNKHDAALAAALGAPLADDAQPTTTYNGLPRLIVPTVRASMTPGETLTLKVIIVDEKPARRATLFWRPLGRGSFAKVPVTHIARGVYEVQLPAQKSNVVAVEYYLKAVTDAGHALVFPATAPTLNQTVVVSSASSHFEPSGIMCPAGD